MVKKNIEPQSREERKEVFGFFPIGVTDREKATPWVFLLLFQILSTRAHKYDSPKCPQG